MKHDAVSSERGFTLLELMIAVVVVAILVSIAYPSFAQQIAKSHRSDAKIALLACAQMLERYSSQNGNYAGGADAAVNGACTGASKNGYYTLPVANVPTTAGAGAFLIQAQPVGGQATDACGAFTYTQDGTKGVSGGSLPSASCW